MCLLVSLRGPLCPQCVRTAWQLLRNICGPVQHHQRMAGLVQAKMIARFSVRLAVGHPAGAASAVAAHIPPHSAAGHVCFDLLAFAPSPRRAAAMSSLCWSFRCAAPCSVQPARQLRSAAHVSNPAPLHNALARRAGGAGRRWVETASGGWTRCSSSRPAGGALPTRLIATDHQKAPQGWQVAPAPA